MSDEQPEVEIPALCLDPEVSDWLVEQARDYFDGSVEKALNHHLSMAMARLDFWREQGVAPGTPPPDPWAALEANLPTEQERSGMD